jgi:hypothetical protein
MRLPVWKRSCGRKSPQPTAQSVSALAKISFQAVHLSDNLVKQANGYITALSSHGPPSGFKQIASPSPRSFCFAAMNLNKGC